MSTARFEAPMPLIHADWLQWPAAFLQPPHGPPAAWFGLERYDVEALIGQGFTPAGEAPFMLYEKTFRCAQALSQLSPSPLRRPLVHCKVYFDHGHLVNVGLDFVHVRLGTALRAWAADPVWAQHLPSVEVRLDPSGAYGSLVIADMLDLRFGRRNEGDRKQKYQLLGLSTDFDVGRQSTTHQVSTGFAKAMKPELNLQQAQRWAAANPALRELLEALRG